MLHRTAFIHPACSVLAQLGAAGASSPAWMAATTSSPGRTFRRRGGSAGHRMPIGADRTDSRAVVYGSNGQTARGIIITW